MEIQKPGAGCFVNSPLKFGALWPDDLKAEIGRTWAISFKKQ